MDIEHKKTVLDDDSVLYQKRDDTIKKKDLSSLSFRQKLQYFKDYYLKFCILFIILLVIGINLIYTVFFRHQETVLSIAFVNDAAISDTEGMIADLLEPYQADDRHRIISVNNYYLEDPNQQMAFTTRLVANDIDIVICDRDTFENKSSAGFFLDLSELLSDDDSAAFSADFVNGQRTETDEQGQILSVGPETPFGIDISASSFYQKYGGNAKEAILCISAGSERMDAAMTFLELLRTVS